MFYPNKYLKPENTCDGISHFYKKNLKFIPYNDIENTRKILETKGSSVMTHEIIPFLKDLTNKFEIRTFVIGKPVQKDNTPSEIEYDILKFIKILHNTFPDINIDRYDERFTSVIAHKTIISSGMKKSKRNNKFLVDKISATVILQSYLENLDK